MAQQYNEHLGSRFPIWTQSGVTSLGLPEMRIEIRVTAILDGVAAGHLRPTRNGVKSCLRRPCWPIFTSAQSEHDEYVRLVFVTQCRPCGTSVAPASRTPRSGLPRRIYSESHDVPDVTTPDSSTRHIEPPRRRRATWAFGPMNSSRSRHGDATRTTSRRASPTRIRLPGSRGGLPRGDGDVRRLVNPGRSRRQRSFSASRIASMLWMLT